MSEKEPAYHTHPQSVRDLPIFGIKLGDGDTLNPDDVYSSVNGLWERCTCPGLTLSGTSDNPVWVRQVPIPPERELVRVGNVYTERRAVPIETKTQEDAAPTEPHDDAPTAA